MKWLKIIGILAAAAVVLVVVFLGYMGMFSAPGVDERGMGPYTIVYESFTGPYKDTGKVFEKVYVALKADGIETTRGLGIYYDNPADVPADKLRSDCGSVVEEADLAKLKKLGSKYNVKVIPRSESAVVEFPIKNMLSYFIGPMKCYPVLSKHAEAKGYAYGMCYELYDMPAKKIYFVMEIEKK